MLDKRYNRRQYWIWVTALLLMKVGAAVAGQMNPDWWSYAGYVDNGIAGALALVVGGRFADAGWRWGLGAGLVILIYVVLPIIVFLPALDEFARTGDLLRSMPPMMTLVTAALLVLLVTAGVRRSVDAAPAERVEPTL